MEKAIQVAKLLVLCIGIALGFQLYQGIRQAQDAIASASKTLDAIQEDMFVVSGNASATLRTAGDTLAAAQPVMGDAARVLAEAQQTLRASRPALRSVSKTLDAATATIQEVDAKDGVLKQSYAAVHDLRLTLDNVNKGAIDERRYMESDLPKISGLVEQNLASSDALLTKAGAATDEADGILADGKLEADKYAHPPKQKWWKRLGSDVKTSAILVYDFMR